MTDDQKKQEFMKNASKALKAADYGSAVDFYTQAIKLYPNDYTLYSNRSAILLARGKLDEALVDAEKCIEIDPKKGTGYVRKADVYNQKGQGAESRKWLEEAGKIDPEDSLLKDRQNDIQEQNMEQLRQQLFTDKESELLKKMQSNPIAVQLMKKDPQLFEKAWKARQNPKFLDLMPSDPYFAELVKEFIKNTDFKLELSNPNEQQQQPQQGEQTQETKTDEQKALEKQVQEKKEAEKPIDEEQLKKDNEAKEQAEKKKAEGNEHFKNGKYQEALKCYNEAFELHKNITYLNNASTTYLKMDKYEDALKIAEYAYNFGQQNLWAAPLQELAKSLAKQGSALSKLHRYQEAISKLKQSMEMNRDKQTLEALNRIEDEYEKVKIAQAYNYEEAEKCYQQGCQEFVQNHLDKAIELLSQGVKFLPDRITEEKAVKLQVQIRAERATALLKNNTGERCVDDYEFVLKKDPKNVKALLVKAKIEMKRLQYYKAIDTFEEVHDIDGENQEAIDNFNMISEKIEKMKRSELPDDEMDAINKVGMADPELKIYANNPLIKDYIKEFQDYPCMLTHRLKDPIVGKKLGKLVNSGILRVFGKNCAPKQDKDDK